MMQAAHFGWSFFLLYIAHQVGCFAFGGRGIQHLL